MSTSADRGGSQVRTVVSLVQAVPVYFPADGATSALMPGGIRAIGTTLARGRAEPGYALWKQENEDRPDTRWAMLDAAQRAEGMRNVVTERLTK